jgi:hypothetical protein
MCSRRLLAMNGDYGSAVDILHRLQARSGMLGKPYAATEQFIGGIEAGAKNDLNRSMGLLSDAYRLDPKPETAHFYINFLGRYAFALPDSVAHGQLRPLRSADTPEDE